MKPISLAEGLDELGAAYTGGQLEQLLDYLQLLQKWNKVYNLTAITQPLGDTITFAYDGNDRLVGITDALGRESTISYDPFGRHSASTDANGNTTSREYDARGRLTSMTEPGGQVWLRSHDESSVPAK